MSGEGKGRQWVILRPCLRLLLCPSIIPWRLYLFPSIRPSMHPGNQRKPYNQKEKLIQRRKIMVRDHMTKKGSHGNPQQSYYKLAFFLPLSRSHFSAVRFCFPPFPSSPSMVPYLYIRLQYPLYNFQSTAPHGSLFLPIYPSSLHRS